MTATAATSENRAHRTILGFTAFSSGYRKRPPSAAELRFFVPSAVFTREG